MTTMLGRTRMILHDIVGLLECDVLDERDRLGARASSTCMTRRGAQAAGR